MGQYANQPDFGTEAAAVTASDTISNANIKPGGGLNQPPYRFFFCGFLPSALTTLRLSEF